MPPSPGACKVIAVLDRAAMPRHPDGRPWCPPGVGADASDEALVRALAAAWGTPGWALDLAGGVLAELGLVAPGPRWIACDPAHRPGTAVGERLAEGAPTYCERGLEQPWPGPWWCNPPWSESARWADKALAEGAPGVFLAPCSNGRWHSRLGRAAAAVVDISPLAFEPCPGLVGFKVTNCPYAVRLYVLPGRTATRPVRPRALDAAHPLGVDCVLWAGPRAGLDAGAPRA